jgi:hypothetical protein
MAIESESLSFDKITNNLQESTSSYLKLTPEALFYMQQYLGKHVELTSVEDQWFYEGPDEGDDHSTKTTVAKGTLINVDGTAVEVLIDSGDITYDTNVVLPIKQKQMKFPFSQDGCTYRSVAGSSQIISFIVEDKTLKLTVSTEQKKTEVMTGPLQENMDLSNRNLLNTRKDSKENTNMQKPLNTLKESDVIYTQAPLSTFEEIKLGSPEDFILYRKLKPDMLQLLKGELGHEVRVSFENERWVQTGPDEEETLKSATFVCGTLTHVDEQSIDVDKIYYGWTNFDKKNRINLVGKNMVFQFHQEQCKLHDSKEILHIQTLTLQDQTLEWERDMSKPTTPYIIMFDNGDDMQACHAHLVNIPDGEDLKEFAYAHLDKHVTPGENGILLETIEKLKPGEKFRNF